MPTIDLSACGLQAGLPILVAVSGGADSLALLHTLIQTGYPLIVASFNHGLRPTAANDVSYVHEVAEKSGIPFVGGSGNVAEHAIKEGLSIEEAARELRYRFLFHAAREAKAQAVATGHTSDDQAETVLMHFVRGAGLSGLKGMPARVILPSFDPQIPLVRPLLKWKRADTEACCRKHELQPCNDASNADLHYFRNRLRHELLPILEQYNPHIKQALSKTALALQGDYDLLSELIQNAWDHSIEMTGQDFLAFELVKLQEMHPALRRNLFRKAAFQLCPGERDIDFDVLSKAAALKTSELTGGLCTYQEANLFYLMHKHAILPSEHWPQAPDNNLIPVVPGQIKLESGWFFTCEEKTGENLYDEALSNTDRLTAWLAADQVEESVHIRTGHSGDRFEPLGMPRQTIKLTDLFVNLKIPKRLRQHWPLVCLGDEIVWVVGLRLSERMKIDKKTRRAIKITVQNSKGQV